MAFSSWSALATAIKDQLADNPEAILRQEYTVSTPTGGQTTIKFRNLKEIFDLLKEVESKDNASNGAPFGYAQFNRPGSRV